MNCEMPQLTSSLIRTLTAVYVGHLFMPFTQSFHPKVRAFALLTPDAIVSVLYC